MLGDSGGRRLITNIFSNWANLVVVALIAFLVSPIIVHRLGNDLYGAWVLIISITAYFTVLERR